VVVSVGDDRALQAAVLAFKAADRALRKDINDATRATFNEPWKSGITGRARTLLERRVLVPGARIAAGNPPSFVAASSTRALSGGLVPAVQWPAAEFGSNRYRQLPARRRKGPVFETLDDMTGRVPRLWAQLIVKAYCDAADESR
jgi:hypothetical protein